MPSDLRRLKRHRDYKQCLIHMNVSLWVVKSLTAIAIETAFTIDFKFLLNAFMMGLSRNELLRVTFHSIFSDFLWLLIFMQSAGWLKT